MKKQLLVLAAVLGLGVNALACGAVPDAAFPQGRHSSAECVAGVRAEKVTCRYCGRVAANARLLAALGKCPHSPSGKHVVLRVPKTSPRKYAVCRYCGARAASVSLLTAGRCSANPRGSKHVAAD